jgi:hypothetical protein
MGCYLKLLAALGAVALVGAFAWGCTSSDTDDLQAQVDELTSQVDALETSVQNTQMVTALNILNNSGLHDLDEAATAGEEIPAGASGAVDRALLAVSVTVWPDDLQAMADDVATALEDLATALDGTDMAAISEAATAAHDAYHDFDHEASAVLMAAAGMPMEEEHEEGEEMEMAATPSPTP